MADSIPRANHDNGTTTEPRKPSSKDYALSMAVYRYIRVTYRESFALTDPSGPWEGSALYNLILCFVGQNLHIVTIYSF